MTKDMWKDLKDTYLNGISVSNCIIAALLFSCIVLVADSYGILTVCYDVYGLKVVNTVIIFSFMITVVLMVKRHWINLLKIPCMNGCDKFVIFVVISALTIGSGEIFYKTLYLYKTVVLVLALIVSIIIFLVRWNICLRKRRETEKTQNEKIDLAQLLVGKIDDSVLPITFSEDISECDLLGRDGLIEMIRNSIRSSNSDHVYVIGIKGPWGSGKTTIINLVKKRMLQKDNNIIIIDDFDPWIFGTQEALLIAMYDEILSKTGMKCSLYSNWAMVNKLKKTVANYNKWSGILDSFIGVEHSDYEAIKQLKQKISAYLSALNKKIVFIIDNIDRTEVDNILFLFKIIGSVFDFPNIVYVLAYDDKRIQEVFADVKKVNPRYIEKIVQQEIVIPDISSERLETICENSMKTILHLYGVPEEEVYRYETLIRTVCNSVTNLRQLKRYLNTSFITVFCYDNVLYKPHLLAIETIRFFEPFLYEMIKNNPRYFISRNVWCFRESIVWEMDRKKFNKDGKNFFEMLFKQFGKYQDLLAELFPYVKRYSSDTELKTEHLWGDDLEHNSSATIASAKYFDLYFSYGDNTFLKIMTSVDQFIRNVNMTKEDIVVFTENVIQKMSKEEQKEWFECLQCKTEEISKNRRTMVAKGICNSLGGLDIKLMFSFISADRIALVVVIKLMREADNKLIKDFIGNCSGKYDIKQLEELCLNCEMFAKNGDDDYRELLSIVRVNYIELCNEIISKKIDIYNDNIYQRLKIWALYRAYEDKEIIHQYMKTIIKQDNLFRILSDMIVESVNTAGYGYSMDEEKIIALFGEEKLIQSMVEKAMPINETEKFILKLWNKMKNRKHGKGNGKDEYSLVPMDLELKESE